MSAKRGVYTLQINEAVFRIVLGATARASFLNRRIETINGLVQVRTEQQDELDQSCIENLLSLGDLSGDIRLFISIKDITPGLDAFRMSLGKGLNRLCTMKEVVGYVALEWDRFPMPLLKYDHAVLG